MVCEQHDAIGHGNLEIARDHKSMGFGWRQMYQSADEMAGQTHG
jgi:hypothetical protein